MTLKQLENFIKKQREEGNLNDDSTVAFDCPISFAFDEKRRRYYPDHSFEVKGDCSTVLVDPEDGPTRLVLSPNARQYRDVFYENFGLEMRGLAERMNQYASW